MNVLSGWIKSQQISPGDIKVGKTIITISKDGNYIIGKILNKDSGIVVISNTNSATLTIPDYSINELVVEFLDKKLDVVSLKQSQWEFAIANGELNTGKLVNFTIKQSNNKLLAKVVNIKVKITQDELDNLTYDAYRKGAEDQKKNMASLGMWQKWKKQSNN